MECIPDLVAWTVGSGVAFLVFLGLALRYPAWLLWLLTGAFGLGAAGLAADLADSLIHGCGA